MTYLANTTWTALAFMSNDHNLIKTNQIGDGILAGLHPRHQASPGQGGAAFNCEQSPALEHTCKRAWVACVVANCGGRKTESPLLCKVRDLIQT